MKRFLSISLVSAVVLSCFVPVIAELPEERVTVIVELETDPLIVREEHMGGDFALFSEEITREDILDEQEEIINEINKKTNNDADCIFSYTDVINGLAIEIDISDIEKIKALPGVKNVEISEDRMVIDDPVESNENNIEDVNVDTCCDLINVREMHESGISGQGQVVAIIDSELDAAHEMFADEPKNPRYSKIDIQNIMKTTVLNASNVKIDDVYKSSKIPFAYNYTKGTGNVKDSSATVHGSHVSGIAVGNNGIKNGSVFDSVAPEAQLIFMAVPNMNTTRIIAALDDVAKFDVDSVNCSWGSAYSSSNPTDPLSKAFTNLINSGVLVSISAGNSGRGFYNTNVPVEMVEYSDGGSPSDLSGVMAVACSSGDYNYEASYAQNVKNATISYFSSWGVNKTLELKPEITAPGYRIYSSVQNNKYALMSGTSMAAPHITGAMALISQYLKSSERFSDKWQNKRELKNLTDSLAMSTASVLMQDKQNNIPYSPRNQGAGLINLSGVMNTPVTLFVDGGKPKISLKDKLANTFQLKFTAVNYSESDVEYKTDVTVIADDYTVEEDNKKYVGNMKLLTSNHDFQNVVIPANESKEITLDITLDNDELSEQGEVFKNGFFIDGFVRLVPINSDFTELGLPFTGFCGNWLKASLLDKPYYDAGSFTQNTYLGSNAVKDAKCEKKREGNKTLDSCSVIGVNYLAKEDTKYDGGKYSGISPNNDGVYDFLCVNLLPLREGGSAAVAITNKSGKTVSVLKKISSFEKFIPKCADYSYSDLSVLPDGDYTVTVTGTSSYNEGNKENITMDFYIDRVAPILDEYNIYKENGNTYLELHLSDNKYVMGTILRNANNGTILSSAANPENPVIKFDITNVNIDGMRMQTYDYAFNTSYATLPEFEISLGKTVSRNDTSSVDIMFVNNTGEKINGNIFAASYDENGKLTAVASKSDKIVKTGIDSFEFSYPTNSTSELKVFIWNDNMQPVKFKAFDLQ